MTLISKVAVYMENFLMYRNKFHAFNSNKKKEDLIEFLNGNDYIDSNIDLTEIVKFYEGISHGFQYEDFLVSKDSKTKILVMRKIELDMQILSVKLSIKDFKILEVGEDFLAVLQ